MLDDFGWSPALQNAFAPFAERGLAPARVTACHRDLWRLMTAEGEIAARLAGRLVFDAAEGGFPVVGDWVAVEPTGGLIHAVLPRSTEFSRRGGGGRGREVLAANADLALIVMSLNADLNPRRLERYLAFAADAGAKALVALTKADLAEDAAAALETLAEVLGETPALTLSALTGAGMEALQGFLTPRATAALFGSSGVGKSTLLNALMGADIMDTGEIRAADDRGRHTTRHRELFRLPNGALLIDTPGLRELSLDAEIGAIDASFEDVAAVLGACRFTNCSHQGEAGCAVAAAIESGSLSPARWRAYRKLEREAAFDARKQDPAVAAADRAKWKKIHKNQAAKYRHRDKNAGWTEED